MQQLDLFAAPLASPPAAMPPLPLEHREKRRELAARIGGTADDAWQRHREREAPPEPEDRTAFDDEQPCICARCHAEGAEAEFFAHDASNGALCPECIREAEPGCRTCGLEFEYSNGRMRTPRRIMPNGDGICYWCNERRLSNLPQPEPRADELTAEALALFVTLEWQDDTHRNRLLYRLREFLTTQRKGGYSAKEKRAAKAAMVTPEEVNGIWAITRDRPLAEIAEDAWQLLDAYDKSKRAGNTGFKASLWAQIDRLLAEANDGTRTGVAVNQHPKRLWKALRVRARAERRLPMWGVPSRFRFESRGMHVIADTDGLSMRLDVDRHHPGDPSFSSTGYRSFGPCGRPDSDTPARTPEEWARGVLEAYIDMPHKGDGGGGLGGKLQRWIPHEAETWARFERDRRDGYHVHQSADRIAHNGALAAKSLAWMQARGIDRYALFPDLMPAAQGALL